jgi:hypothetical protein
MLHIAPGLVICVFLPSLSFESANRLDDRELRGVSSAGLHACRDAVSG